jgi:hypothetical protein
MDRVRIRRVGHPAFVPNVNERREIVSVNGGRFPRWGPKGSNELYYVAPDGAMMAVPVEQSPTLTLGRPAKLFDWQKPGGRSGRLYDVAPDGGFLMTKSVAPNPDSQTHVSLVLNLARDAAESPALVARARAAELWTISIP